MHTVINKKKILSLLLQQWQRSFNNKYMSYIINKPLNNNNGNDYYGGGSGEYNIVANATIENQSNQFHYEIGLGSINRMKIESIRKSFPSNYFVIPTKVLIPIPNPKTKIDTYQMAKYRTIVTRDIYPRLDLYIGIQYGMWKEDAINFKINENVIKTVNNDNDDDDDDNNNNDKWIGACVYMSNRNGDDIALWTDLLSYNVNKDNSINNDDNNNNSDNFIVVVDSIESKLLQNVFRNSISFDYIEWFINKTK